MAKKQKNFRLGDEHVKMLSHALEKHNEKMKSEGFPIWSESDYVRYLIDVNYAEGRKKENWPSPEEL